MNNRFCVMASVLLVGLGLTVGRTSAEIKLPESQIQRHWLLAQAHSGIPNYSNYALFASADTSFSAGKASSDELVRPKSPAKAFALSMLIPGLGQYYNGNKVKAAAFLGIEATAWILQFKYRADGNRLTNGFEAFQQAHWSESRYGDYLEWAYIDSLGHRYRSDDSISAQELSHHLPDTKTQQYYEMTGKYNQFAWGWDDATLHGQTLQDYVDVHNVPVAVGLNVPSSANRTNYETLRYNANQKFSSARKMIMLALGNRLVSAFEAFISAKKSQIVKAATGKGPGKSEFSSHWKFSGRLRSVYARYDTPYVKVTYGF